MDKSTSLEEYQGVISVTSVINLNFKKQWGGKSMLPHACGNFHSALCPDLFVTCLNTHTPPAIVSMIALWRETRKEEMRLSLFGVEWFVCTALPYLIISVFFCYICGTVTTAPQFAYNVLRIHHNMNGILNSSSGGTQFFQAQINVFVCENSP